MNKPIDDLTAIFFQMLYKACHGNCVIAGTAALAYHLLPQKLFRNDDVDIFVPLLPRAMFEFANTGTRIHPTCPGRGPHIASVLHDVECKLWDQHRIYVRNTTANATLPHLITNEWHDYTYGQEVFNIHSLDTFQLVRANTTSKIVQLIILKGYPTIEKATYSNNLWGEHVVSTFNLNIKQIFLTPPVHITRSKKLHACLRRRTSTSIQKRKALLTISPCQHYKPVLKQLDICKKRHFRIQSIHFHKDSPEVWISYVIRRLAAHDPDILSAIDIWNHPAVHSHQKRPKLTTFMRKHLNEQKKLRTTFISLIRHRTNVNARESLDYYWK
jgi:hypothetical protein